MPRCDLDSLVEVGDGEGDSVHADLSDDTVISEELILGSTGTNDDFCEVAVGALT